MEQKIITASANMGIGLWTAICVFFCAIFGRESKTYKNKQNTVLNFANGDLLRQLKSFPKYKISDYRVTWQRALAVTVSAIITFDSKDIATPSNH